MKYHRTAAGRTAARPSEEDVGLLAAGTLPVQGGGAPALLAGCVANPPGRAGLVWLTWRKADRDVQGPLACAVSPCCNPGPWCSHPPLG